VALLEAGAYDLLLLDMFIPDMDGFQIMDHINRQGIDLLIIVITGNASIESAVKALKKGAFDYLKKPFEYEELLKRVGNALNQKKLAHEKQIMRGKLERAEERNQFLVQNSPDIIYMLDEEGRFLFVNGTVRNLLGYDPAQLTGEPFSYFVYPEDIDKAESVLAAGAGGNGVLRRREVRLSVRDTPDDFKLFELEHGAITLSDAAEGEAAFGTYGVARDITYRKQLEQQLLHAQKMEAIGTLAAGIAHDFNNILFSLIGYAEISLEKAEPG
ncbi:MAG: response regulator, partial [Deltaproteobacteria bacterium]|nr:response regulator [Deltaproteobacteria bacterium]